MGRQSSAVHAPCLNYLAESRMVAETRDPWNSNFFWPLVVLQTKLTENIEHARIILFATLLTFLLNQQSDIFSGFNVMCTYVHCSFDRLSLNNTL